MTDLKFALRQLLKNPGFAAMAVLTLALGIVANTAVFSAMQAALLRPMTEKNPDRLVTIMEVSENALREPYLSYPDFKDLSAGTAEIFSDVIAISEFPRALRLRVDPIEALRCE